MAVYLKLYGVGVIKKLVRDNISSTNESISQSTNESNMYGEIHDKYSKLITSVIFASPTFVV